MTDFQFEVFRMLRVFGPCSEQQVARRLKVPVSKACTAIQKLCHAGLAVHPIPTKWDVSAVGRRWFATRTPEPQEAL